MRQFHLRVSPLFFLTAFLIGFLGTQNFLYSFLWMVAIFISILFHEMGHALMAISFSQSVLIQLGPFGGATIPFGPKMKLSQEFIMVLMGPVFGFLLLIISGLLLVKKVSVDPNFQIFCEAMIQINLVWTVVNLLPVLPMDGGQLVRIILEGIFGFKGRKYACIIGLGISLILGFGLIVFKLIFPSIFFFFFAFQNYEIFKRLKMITEEDEELPLKEELKEAINLSKKHDEHAIQKLEGIRSHSGKGLVFVIASQELAENYIAEKNFQKAFEILQPIYEKLLDSGKILLQKAAFEIKEDEVVLQIANECLISVPDQEIILRALASAARKKDLEATLGWLQTAKDFGCKDLKNYLQSAFFDLLKEDPKFKEAIDKVEG